MSTFNMDNVQANVNVDFEKAVAFLNIYVSGKSIGGLPLKKSNKLHKKLISYLTANPDADIKSAMSVNFNLADSDKEEFEFDF